MAQQMKFTPDQITSFNFNAIIYHEKLLNQSRELDRIIETISDGWKGTKAKKCIEALRASSAEYKLLAKEIEPLINAIKKVIDKVKEHHGEV